MTLAASIALYAFAVIAFAVGLTVLVAVLLTAVGRRFDRADDHHNGVTVTLDVLQDGTPYMVLPDTARAAHLDVATTTIDAIGRDGGLRAYHLARRGGCR